MAGAVAGGGGARVAVRSSALGEDSEELSAAGQNETLLGLRGADEVLRALRRCWASLFAFQSVEYRRQHGQPILCGMGVVVQVMVPAQKAGVLFTHHPVSGASHQILITANYGLGETVVSARVEPDTVVLERDWSDNLSIAETTCGSKALRMQMDDGGGVASVALDSNDAKQLCLSSEEILRLGKIGLELEAAFGGPRDIEWAIVDDEIYLLQSRPITSLDAWTSNELLHELDGVVTSDNEVLTTGNTGEVFPKIISPLTNSLLIPVLDQGVSASAKSFYCRYCSNTMSVSHHRVLLNVHNTMYLALEKEITTGIKVAEIAIYGHVASTPELYQYGLDRHGPMSPKAKIMNLIYGITASFWNNHHVKKAQEVLQSIKMNECPFDRADMLYLAITQNFRKVLEIATCHSLTTRVSVFSQVVAMMILTEGSEELTNEHFNDISLLLSSCSDVVSASVPEDIKALAEAIIKSERGDDFCELPPDLAVEWLETNSGEIATQYKHFLSKHGHRCIQEFDVMSETWAMKPDSIVSTIQTMVRTPKVNQGPPKQSLSPEDTVMQLKSVKSDRTRSVLSVLLPWCRRTVAGRESTKAAFIGAVHQMRLAYRRLAQMLVRDGRLPDAHLVFFLTHYELGQLLATRSAKLLAKASRRRRLWPQWENLKLPEMIVGLPQPLDTTPRRAAAEGSGGARLHGTPVWAGTVMGRACVVHHLGEISQLRSGDVLITHSTDIGWSPYFPLLGGVVTELGGLISHGAVVAREYGLPCIVGAEGATDLFETGDTVLLVGATGTLEKIDC